MRGFIFVLCLFSLLIVGIIINYYYVHSFYLEIDNLVNKLTLESPKENRNIIIHMKKIWETKGKWLCISMGRRERNEISISIDKLYLINEQGDKSQIKLSIQTLKSSLDEIIRLERFCMNNIF